jgi:hypothetical protein
MAVETVAASVRRRASSDRLFYAGMPLAILAVVFVGFASSVATGAAYDVFSRGRVHPAYIWGGLLLFASQPLRLALGHTQAWTTFAGMVIR